ncbi:hypothetical protein KIK06_05620 [Nocardiopsis sp. EMB25]|uniref:hypothetical protein n=1 Tax=Nocardiopsis sp. EMB25 TaxID=2835867 RepID=UPI0022843D94|nr:hypothetical protein [Nocardiopsis sp. EMB25]MCY9783373.1 hypothetical protein [Nocardiopsis sp. EMB25]
MPRHARLTDQRWDRILHVLLAAADAAGRIDRRVAVDATIDRSHGGPTTKIHHAVDGRGRHRPSS